MKAARKLRSLQQPRSLLDYVRQFLTPQVWKQARQAVPRGRALPRWDLQPLVLIMLAMTWAAGDSQAEKFEKARGFYVACYAGPQTSRQDPPGVPEGAGPRPPAAIPGVGRGRARPDPAPLRRAVAGRRLRADGLRWLADRVPAGRGIGGPLGRAGKDDSAPTLWVTAFVHLSTGLLWSWRLGPGPPTSRCTCGSLLGTLSPAPWSSATPPTWATNWPGPSWRVDRSFLFRMSSKVHLYTLEEATLEGWSEGPVLYWPEYAQQKGSAPLSCRLIRVPARGQVKRDVWLLTDVLDPARLSVATAAKFYRWRWRNEGLFRTYKRTINKMKLSSRTVRLVHREAELSLLATAVPPGPCGPGAATECDGDRGRTGDQPAEGPDRDPPGTEGVDEPTGSSYRQRLRGCRAEDANRRARRPLVTGPAASRTSRRNRRFSTP